MVVYQPGSGIFHDLSYFSPHQRLVAMDTAGRTCRLGSTEAALVQLHDGIMNKLFAFITRDDPGMMLAAI